MSLFCLAQKNSSNLQSISLTDGSVIIGEVIEDTNAYLLVEIIGGEQIKLYHKYIRKISKSKSNHYFLDNGRSFKDKGFFFSYFAGNSFNTNGAGASHRGIFGKYYKHKWAFGLGSGIDLHSAPGGEASYVMVPLYLHARGYPFDKRVSPYYALNIGYGFPLQSLNGTTKGGYMINPMLGLRFASRRKSSFSMEMGLIVQEAKGDYVNWRNGVAIKEELVFRRIMMTIGWVF